MRRGWQEQSLLREGGLPRKRPFELYGADGTAGGSEREPKGRERRRRGMIGLAIYKRESTTRAMR